MRRSDGEIGVAAAKIMKKGTYERDPATRRAVGKAVS